MLQPVDHWFSFGDDLGPPPKELVVAGNTLSGNHLNGAGPNQMLSPENVFTDGGGNVFGPPVTQGGGTVHRPSRINRSLILKRLGRHNLPKSRTSEAIPINPRSLPE